MRKRIDIDQALLDKNLLGAALGDLAPWKVWRVVLRAAFALGLGSDEERAIFAEVSGGRPLPPHRVQELWAILARRTGKSRMAAAIGVYLALFLPRKLAPGESGEVTIISAVQAQANVVFKYVVGFLEASPVLRQEIESITRSEVRLRGSVVLSVRAGNFRTVRSRTLLGAIVDEVAFLRDESSALADIETYRALLPALATTGGMLIGISTPYRRAGLLYQKHRDFFGVDDPDVLVVAGNAQRFNPTLDSGVIERARASDPESARSEWDAEFRIDIASYLDDPTIEASVNYSRPLELPPQPGIFYKAFVDASGGRRDHYTICVAHKDRASGQFTVDLVRGVAPPFDPMQATEDFAKLLRDYHILSVTGDNFGQEWVQAAWRSCNIRYAKSELPKSQIYLECLPLFTRGLVSIPEHKRLLRELRLLERHTHRSGRDTVDHGKNGSDDYCNVVAGALRDLSNYLGYSLDNLTRACSTEEEDPNSEAARKARDQEYRSQFAAHIFMLSGGQCYPR